MALPDERSGEQSRLPPRPAKALSGRDPEKLDPPVSIRCRELGVSEVRRQSLPQDLGSEAIFVRSDVRKDEDVRNLVDQTVKRFGRLDIAVNNAGTEGSPGLV